jgi:DNA-binding NarL/FixJ family response regulator
MAVSIMLVDDQARFRQAMDEMVGAMPGFEMASECSSGEEALREVDAVAPDLVLMDVRMPGMGGVEATRRITERYPEIVVILISAEDADMCLPDSARACGAAEFVRKQDLRPGCIADLWSRHRPLVEAALRKRSLGPA